jgi:hypothetical protein
MELGTAVKECPMREDMKIPQKELYFLHNLTTW